MPTYLTQPLHRAAQQRPDAPALWFDGRALTWAALHDRVARLAAVLRDRGVGKGDRVALLAHNSDETVVAILATLWIGGVVTPLNTRWSLPELRFAIADADVRLLLADVANERNALALRDGGSSLAVLGLPGLAGSLPDVSGPMAAVAPVEDVLAADQDPAFLLYTGGTTGRSKGVLLSHLSLYASAASFAGFPGATPGPTMLQTAPLFHIAGIGLSWGALLAGSRQILHAAFDPVTVMAAIEREGVTDMFLVPSMLQAIVDHPRAKEFDLGSLARISYGASPIADALLSRAEALLPQTGFIQAYGMTELSPIATLLGPDGHRGSRRRSAGRATLMTEVRIVDPQDREVARGETGEIVVRGGVQMLRYWNMPDETAEALRGGWMHTGDVGRMDEEGYIFVVDRLKDMIITGGENVYSTEVENALASHPGVRQCAVIGVPSEKWGESVHAVIVPKDGARPQLDDLVAHCRKTIAGFKVPRSMELRESLPLSAAGKVLKTELRAATRSGDASSPT